MSWRQWSIPVLWFAAVLSVVSQTSPVTSCVSTYDWSINSLQQTPCLVTAYLESACGTATEIPAVPVGNHYLGPGPNEVNPCRCSSVTYSTISACAGCQNRTYIDWLTWSQDCTIVYPSTFIESLPSAVVVPSWAYLNLSLTNNNFSLAVAEQNATDTASATPSAITTSTSVSESNSLTSTPLALTTASPTSSTSAGNSKSNAGAIAGGVVGGLGFAAIVALGSLWFCLRRKRNMVQRNVAFDSRALVSGTASSQTTGSMQGVSPFLSQRSQSIYTSDRSLYPGSPLTTTGVYTAVPSSRRSLESVSLSVAQFGGGPQTYGNVPVVPRGYTGMPEI